MGYARAIGALCVLLFSSSVLAQARLDYRQEKEFKDARSYLDEVARHLAAIDKAMAGMKPGDVPVQDVDRVVRTRDAARQRLGYANNRLTKLPAGNAQVKEQVDRAAELEKSLAAIEPKLAAIKGGAQRAVEQGRGAGYQADFDRLKELNQMFGDPQILQRLPEQAIEVVKQIPNVKAERQRIAAKYADLLKQDTPESNRMKGVLRHFDGQFGRFDQAVAQYAAAAPQAIEKELAQAADLVKRGVADKNHLFFGPDGGINQFLRQAQTRVNVLAAVDADAAKAPAAKLQAARADAARASAALMDEIVKSNPAPRHNYTGPDAAALVGVIRDAWARSGNAAPVLASGINANAWQRSTRWEWDGTDTWNKVDRSKLQGYVAVKASDTVANIYYINLDKDHLADDRITAHFFSDPNKDPGVINKVLVSKLK